MNQNISILYISTNPLWSGSEELWFRSAVQLAKSGHHVMAGTLYELDADKKAYIRHHHFTQWHASKSIIQRGVERLLSKKFKEKRPIEDFISKASPDLVVFSQGNNYEATSLMLFCNQQDIPYITVTQLVAEPFLWDFKNGMIRLKQKAYQAALKNFFVSRHNLELNNLMLGIDLANAEVVHNPCKLVTSDITPYPTPKGTWQIGFVGRIESWHKGLDLLIEIAKMQKWKERPISFNLYGNGPHTEFIETNVQNNGLKNIVLKSYAKNVGDVWSINQLLIMPSRMEGQALALIEAMFCQRAALVTDVGGAGELIEEGYNGFIADAPTVKSIDAALERAWDKRDHWKELGLNAAASLKAKYPADAVQSFNEKVLELLRIKT